ncbi:UNVERIFIED_CONTAM: hypothetical protein Scaly_1425900 [Sesamum calycinum]|uniref:ARM repeat superfamily protein n=1 Tax=Sesamum calycinum TaxID=2727403 RepID=A0AAW2PQN2_9LAMI
MSLSFPASTQLLKSFLSSLYVYWGLAFLLPKGVMKAIESKLRMSLCQGNSGRGSSKVAWSQVCLPTQEGGLGIRSIQVCHFYTKQVTDEKSIEEEAERKIGWLLKLIFAGTATVIAYNLLPYMGENLVQQSVSLLNVKDPLFKRMGASRLARIAIDDKRRMKIVELGGAKELVKMLATAKDDRTRKAALRALVAISKSDEAVGALHEAGAIPVIRSTPDSTEYNEIEQYKLNLLSRFQDLRYDVSS